MVSGRIFDIKEFAINDGPGIRLTVFMKGCPLHCVWCHNPEGMAFSKELNVKTGKMTGEDVTPAELVAQIRKFCDVFALSGGGVTFSGGEPTAQGVFLCETASLLTGIHRNLDTAGYCEIAMFAKVLQVFDLVYFDLKLADGGDHLKFTGVPNTLILDNLTALANSEVPFVLRLPQIPGITDTAKNHAGLEQIIRRLPRKPERIDLLSYNELAGGKYATFRKVFQMPENLKKNFQVMVDFQKRMSDYKVKIY